MWIDVLQHDTNNEAPKSRKTVGDTAKNILREFAIKWTKSLINIGDEVFIESKTMATYLKKMKFSDAIVDAAMRQAGFHTKTPTSEDDWWEKNSNDI